MPTDTFFRLPEEKRERLLRAALEEFSRVPFPQASINKIIQGAGVPRGSFYMYFADKEDLFCHLLRSYRTRLCRLTCDELDRRGGDLFAALLAIHDRLALAAARAEDGCGGERLLSVLRLNAALSPDLLFRALRPGELLEDLSPHLDRGRLSLRGERDLEDILHVLIGVTVSSLAAGAAGEAGPERARHFRDTLDLLKRGMAAPSPHHLTDPEEPV